VNLQQAQPGIAEARDELRRVIGGMVVDDDDFPPLGPKASGRGRRRVLYPAPRAL
jgi:hypothetical protein